MNKYAAIYIRVSTDAQREEGYSIDAQKEMLTAHCVSKGIKKYKYYIDGGFTGSNINRPELKRLIGDINDGLISCVLVYKLDRLSRSQKDTLYLIEDIFNPNGVDFVSLNESMDTSTPLGRLMLGILSAFAQLERENIRERTSMGMKERIKAGYWMGGGRVPFGYDYDQSSGILVPNQDSETVKRVYSLYLSGYSTASISKILGISNERLTRQILARKTYAGYMVYKGEEYIGKHIPIIELDTFLQVQSMRELRGGRKIKSTAHLLSGFMVCGDCGTKMRYQKWGNSGYKIVCYSHDKSKAHIAKADKCQNNGVWAEELEDIVKEDLFSFGIGETTKNQGNSGELEDVLRLSKNKINDKLKKLYNLYSESDNDVLLETIKELEAKVREIDKEIKSSKREKALLLKRNDIKKQLKTLRESWDYMTFQERRNIIESCVLKIEVNNNDVKIYYKI